MNPELEIETRKTETQTSPQAKNLNRLKIFGVLLTLGGIALFAYFIKSVGVDLILTGIEKIGWLGFAFILLNYFTRMIIRAVSWCLSIGAPYKLRVSDTLPAVIIGEALSSLIPLGILISGTSKAVAVRQKVPLVVGLSSIATENLFYSFATGIFIALGAFAFLRGFDLPTSWILTVDLLIFVVLVLIVVGVLMIIYQWHWTSSACGWLYNRGIGKRFLENGREQVRLFENQLFGFYHQYPKRILPIMLLQVIFHLLGILEVWFVLNRISDAAAGFYPSFLLESMSRSITIFFKLVPFLIGVDEAGAHFVTQTLALGAGVGVTLAIIRKGRVLFWTAAGVILIVKRGLSWKEMTKGLE